MGAGEWIAFASLMFVVISGGVSAAIWIIMAINKLATRIAVLETTLKLAMPELQVAQSARRIWDRGIR